MGLVSRLIKTDEYNKITLYEDTHILKAIILIGKGPVGRKRLVKELNIGEGSVRTMIRKLEEKNILYEDLRGCELQRKGKLLYKILNERLNIITSQVLGEYPYEMSVVIKHGASSAGRGLEIRDNVIRKGGEGALIISKEGRELWFPHLTNLNKEHADLAKKINSLIPMDDGDLVIIAWGNDPKNTERGVLYATLELLKKLDL